MGWGFELVFDLLSCGGASVFGFSFCSSVVIVMDGWVFFS